MDEGSSIVSGEIFEFGSGKNYSINEVADMFNHHKTYVPERPGEYDVTLADYSKANEILGWIPKGSLSDYVKEAIG